MSTGIGSTDPQPGSLHWKLSSHPISLLFFLGFRIASLFIYIFGLFFTDNFVLIFIVTVLLLSADFYFAKNIAGRRLVGLRWWNEVNTATGDSHWVFESADPETRIINATDKRFFWLAMYAQPVLWVALAIIACIKLQFISLSLVVIALVLTITNTVAFSRCDKFSQVSNTFSTTGFAQAAVGKIFSRILSSR